MAQRLSNHSACVPSVVVALLLIALMQSPKCTRAYPELVEYPTCDFHPDETDRDEWVAHHAAIILNDPATAMTLMLNNTPTMTVCPGQRHTVTVAFSVPGTSTPQLRRALLSISQGSFIDDANRATTPDRRCSNRIYLAMEREAMSTQYTLPFSVGCSVTGQVVLEVTSAFCEIAEPCDSSLFQVLLTADVDASCAAAACRPPAPPPTATLAPPPPSSPTNATTPLPSNTPLPPSPVPPPPSPSLPSPPSPAPPAPPPSPPAPRTVGLSCQRSDLGYECARTIAGKITIHWSQSGSTPPPNACTGSNPAGSSPSTSNASAAPRMLHFAAVAAVEGYVSIGFVPTTGIMQPADLVLGYIDFDEPYINSFSITQDDVAYADENPPNRRWASHLGVAMLPAAAQNSSGGGGGSSGPRTMICFSRKAEEPLAVYSSRLDPSSMVFMWAIHARPRMLQHETGDYGSGVVDLFTGIATEVPPKDIKPFIDAHGALMLAAWVLCAPLGVLISMHRWTLQGHTLMWRAAWFSLHLICQFSGAALFLASLIIAFVKFPDPVGELMQLHAILGYVVIGLCGVQMLLGALARPGLDSPFRSSWTAFHSNLGKGTILIAWVAVYTGIVAYYKSSYGTSLAAWLIPAVGVTGLMVLADTVLQAIKPKPQPPPVPVVVTKGDAAECAVVLQGIGSFKTEPRTPVMYG